MNPISLAIEESIQRAKEQSAKQTGKKRILVFKGLPYDELHSLENKYFKNWPKIIVNETDIAKLKEQILQEIINNTTSNEQKFWMTYEELIVSYEMIKNNFEILIIDNNIYNTKYPFDGTIKNVERVYQNYFYNVEEEIGREQDAEYSTITDFYGEISYSPDSKQYYVVYNQSAIEEIPTIPLYQLEEDNFTVEMERKPVKKEGAYFLELSDDETPFLDLVTKLFDTSEIPEIIYVTTMVKLSDLPNRYRERTEILQELFRAQTTFYFTMKTMENTVIESLSEYEKILKDYWGYTSFRELDMYKDVRGSDRKIVKISQAQIIDDLVKQASLALEKKSYRDVFITSPTGSGKSVMFQVPSMYLTKKYKELNPLTIVISPLIALMNDQVDNMQKQGINISRTINSNTAPFERDKILEEVSNGTCTILYLSPETLQSRYDIKLLIGDRNIGLVIIDEAHIVTTWGRSFRADYWYLGIYLQKLRKEYRFPIVTFTATAIYGGPEDMYLDTRDSLNMINPISYFGNVKRNDICMLISSTDKEKVFDEFSRDYRKVKNQLTLKHLNVAYNTNEKSLIYFPTIKSLNSFSSFLRLENKDMFAKTGHYHGQMQKEEKDQVLKSFRDGEMQFVLATKAFGMGVDIPDIKYVYHYAPTGSVTDYVQEIGRVARDKKKVETGVAWCDFLSEDFHEVKKLHGMSRIRKDQLIQIMQKIINLYHAKGNNRNLLVSAEDFKYIFNEDREDIDGLDNKIKTALLLIEKDFSSPNNIGFPPFAARPRSVFGNDLVLLDSVKKDKLMKSSLRPYFNLKYLLENSHYEAVYSFDLSSLWEDHYKNYSFPDFKRRIFTRDEHNTMKHGDLFSDLIYSTGISVIQKSSENINDSISKFNAYIHAFSDFSAQQKMMDKYFTVKELGYYLAKKLYIKDVFKARSIAQALINSCFEYQKLKDYQFIRQRPQINNETSFYFGGSYDVFIDFAVNTFTNFFKWKNQYYEGPEAFIKFYVRKSDKCNQDMIILGLAEAMELVQYNVENGNTPQIYLRINAIGPMDKVVKQGKFYKNSLLDNVYLRHKIGVEMLTYLFKHKVEAENKKEEIEKYTSFFWNEIEDYFLGHIPPEVEARIYKKN